MSEWIRMKLSECCSSIADGDHQPPPKAETGIPFVTISNMTSSNQFDFSDTLFVPQEYYDKLDEKRKARKDDILYSVVGSFGIPVFMKEDKVFVFQRHIAILRPDNKKIVPRFLFYTMLTKDFYAKADAAAIGAAQRTVSLTALRNMEICIPDKIQQSEIVDTLAAYDDLIENNQKQIKLLEEAARRLYKEWFVDLRFPGHENVEIIDGVPEGWHMGTVQEVIEYHDTKRKPLSGQQREKMKGEYRYYGAAGILDYVNAFLFDGVYLLLGEDGTVVSDNGCPVLQYVAGQFWVNNHAHVLTGKGKYSTEYIYMMFAHMKILDVVTGVAQPKISQGRLSAKKILIPAPELAVTFDVNAKPFFDKILILENQITKLEEARDRLLPKLMSGEIEL